MWLSDTAVKRPVFATMVIAAFLVFGAISYNGLGVNEMPEVDFPVITVTTILPGADPETMEIEVSDRIEEAVNTIDGIDQLRSTSTESVSVVVVEFDLEKDVDVAAQDVRDKIAGIRQELPDQIEEPRVEKLDFDAIPALTLVVTGRDVPANEEDEEIRRITEISKTLIQEPLQTIKGVGSVDMIGDQEREIRIWLDADRMRGYNIPVDAVIGRLRSENVDIPGGRIETREREIVVKTEADFKSVEEFNDLIVSYVGGNPVRLRDIGYAEDGMEDLRSLAYLGDKRAIALNVRKISGGNLVEIADRIKEQLPRIRETLPDDMNLVIAIDNSTFAKDALRDVTDTMLIGGTFAVLVIFFFLRSFRTALIAATVLPVAVISTYTFMGALGFTLNQLTMLALTISIGLLIDDAVVVIESIHRTLEEDRTKPRQAAMKGTSEIALAVVTASATILGVFVPVAFMTGLIGRFFYEFGLTVAFAVMMSLFVSLTLTPMMSALLLRPKKADSERGIIYRLITAFLRGLDGLYKAFLGWTLRHRWITLIATLAVFWFSMQIAAMLPGEFLPPQDEGRFAVAVEAPIGSSIETTREAAFKVADVIERQPGVEQVLITIGGTNTDNVTQASLTVDMIPLEERAFSQVDLMNQVRSELDGNFAGLKTAVTELQQVGGSAFSSYMLNYSLRGTDMEQLIAISERLKNRLAEEEGFVDLDTSYDSGKPQVEVHIDRNRAADLGVSVAGIASSVNALIGGMDVTTFESSGEQYDVRVRLSAGDRDEATDINNLLVMTSNGRPVELSNLVRLEESTGAVEINRRNRLREITVNSNLAPDMPLGTATAIIDDIVREMELPAGVIGEHIGMAEMMQESFESMLFSLILAIVIIYMALASLFESLIHPFTIMISLPLSFSGAMGLLLIFGKTLNIMSFIGFIMLMGLVTKNAILLIDRAINNRDQRGMERYEALLEAGYRRLRPILMTSISTIAGALPVALGLGAGAGFRSSMGVAIVGGMITSTLLTLIAVPMIYTFFDDLSSLRLPDWLKFWKRKPSKVAQRREAEATN